MSGKLQGKVAIVTGASSGLGLATALALASEGASLVLAARRKDRLEALAQQIKQKGGETLVAAIDIADEKQVRGMVEDVRKRFGRVDILINNAGVMLNAPVAKAALKDLKQMLDINLFGLMCATQAVLPMMKTQGGGHIVNVSSASARSMMPSAAAYAGTKAAVFAFSEALRKETSPDRIRVTVVAPGAAVSELRDHITDPGTKAVAEKYVESMRPLQAEDVAAAILYAVTQPEHVGVNEIVLRSVDQIP